MKNNIKKVNMLYLPVTNMPKMKKFMTENLNFQITKEYKQNNENWWTSIKLPDDDLTLTLSTYHGKGKPGIMTFYLLAPEIKVTHDELEKKGVKVSPIGNDLYGPNSGVQWFSLDDPDGNVWMVAEE